MTKTIEWKSREIKEPIDLTKADKTLFTGGLAEPIIDTNFDRGELMLLLAHLEKSMDHIKRGGNRIPYYLQEKNKALHKKLVDLIDLMMP